MPYQQLRRTIQKGGIAPNLNSALFFPLYLRYQSSFICHKAPKRLQFNLNMANKLMPCIISFTKPLLASIRILNYLQLK